MINRKFVCILSVIFTVSTFSAWSTNAYANEVMISNGIRILNHELSIGLDYDFFIENSTYNSNAYSSFMHGLSLDMGYSVFPDSTALFGFSCNFGCGMPFGIISTLDYQKIYIDHSTSNMLGFTLKNSVGCAFRYMFDKWNRIDAFLGAVIDYYYLAYDTGLETVTRNDLQNVVFGLQARFGYTYSFNNFIAIYAGAIFDYGFYSVAQIKYSDLYTSYALFEICPVCKAVMKF